MNKKRIRLLFALYLGFLLLFAVIPLSNESNKTLKDVHIISIRLDYLLHACLFIPWVFLYSVAFRPLNFRGKSVMIIAGLLMALATESVQYFLPYRSYNINDMMANWMGIMIGASVMFIEVPLINWMDNLGKAKEN